jgi:hypothetical protein
MSSDLDFAERDEASVSVCRETKAEVTGHCDL